MASILDVANEANVAPSTVSLVMNHRGRVSPETQKRVDAAIGRLGYSGRGNRMRKAVNPVKALRFGFVYTPEALVDGMESNYCRQLIRGVEQSLGGASATLNIMRGQSHIDQDQMFIQHLRAHELDGVAMLGANIEDGYVERTLDAGVPLVLFNRPTSQGRYSCVSVDYFNGARQAIDHLVEIGHKRIGLLIAPGRHEWPLELLHTGAISGLREHGLEPAADLTMPVFCTEQDFDGLCRRMVDAGVTAIWTGDITAVPCIAALERMGLKVPDDISVMRFDGGGQVSASGFRISTITYNRLRMGRMAGRILQKLGRTSRSVAWLGGAVRTKLKIGQTTSSPCK